MTKEDKKTEEPKAIAPEEPKKIEEVKEEIPVEPRDERKFVPRAFGFNFGKEGEEKFTQGTFFQIDNHTSDCCGLWGDVPYESLSELLHRGDWPSELTKVFLDKLQHITYRG